MKYERRSCIRSFSLAAAVVFAAAGCAVAPGEAGPGNLSVSKVERRNWNAPPETGLFRVIFDAARAQDIRRRAEARRAQEDIDYVYAEMQAQERDVDIELKSRGLCGGGVKFVIPVDEGRSQDAMDAIFQCRSSLF